MRTEIIDSGVVVNTIGFGPEAPGNLLAQIAADTGGIYRPVATTAAGSGAPSAASVETLDALAALDMPVEAQQALVAPVAPGQLGLANVFNQYDDEAQGAQRLSRLLAENVAERCISRR